ncbi:MULTISPECIES: hypothetical protein [Mycolicibacterium]|uniref:Uncharacterized protein n=2 Tax=Mycolicibacterium TaxID=1866885 RepID=A0A1A0W989_MYCPR|nr:hypothetical protein [Mycolicibacterium peregrinum]OBB92898.1 hypothetical protein A5779_21280 [Mycolicibacterium peregrinum]
MTVAGSDETDVPATKVVATAVSAKRTLMAEVDQNGFVVGIRVLSDAVRQWDSWTLGENAVAVAAVARDRYLANQPHNEATYPTHQSVAADERRLKF